MNFPAARFIPTAVFCAGCLLPALAIAQDSSLLARSPFLPPTASGPSGAGGAAETYELAGASITGTGTEICLYDTQQHRSRWATVGKSENGIEVVSYDGANDQAVVRFDGRTHVLNLRKANIGSPGLASAFIPPSYAPTPPPTQNPATPIADPSIVGKSPDVVKQEREARMLVSDLLEIGIQQRKAYEEAQKKAAGQKGG